MTEYCDVLFTIDPSITCEEMFSVLRSLDDNFDVYINYNDILVDYEPDGIVHISVRGEIPDLDGYWDRLVEGIKDLDGIEIDFEGMREWLND